MLPSLFSLDALELAVWLLVGSFLIRTGWSLAGWLRRRYLKD